MSFMLSVGKFISQPERLANLKMLEISTFKFNTVSYTHLRAHET